jgi:hypothetical protein
MKPKNWLLQDFATKFMYFTEAIYAKFIEQCKLIE